MAESDDEAKKRAEQLKQEKAVEKSLKDQAKMRLEISSSMEEYRKALKALNEKESTIRDLKKDQKKLTDEIAEHTKKGNTEDIKKAQAKLNILQKQTKEIEKQGEKLKGAIEGIDPSKIITKDFFSEKSVKSIGKSISGIDKQLMGLYGKLKSLGLFEMDRAIRQSALEMGVLSKETVGYRTSIKDVAKSTARIGIGVKELTELQSAYTDELGRNVMLTNEGLEAMAEIAAATQLGVQGTAELAANMENMGVSAERTKDFVNLSLKSAHKLGLNAAKTMKNMTSGMKLLNKYHFAEGTKGLAKMARTVTKLGVDMEFAANMADKLWDVEGAVDMSAQLQVMGGEFAKMADPFHLMYMARNDINGLTEELANASAASAKFNAETGEFELGAMEMHRLKIIAEQTGVEYDKLVTAGRNAAKFSKIKAQMNFTIGGGKEGKEIKEFITNKAMLDEKGKAYIKIGSDKKFLSQLTATDKGRLKIMAQEEENMQERAKNAQDFDTAFNNLINGLKVYLLPVVETMNKSLIPALDNFSKWFVESGMGKTIEDFSVTMGDWISSIAKLMIDHPIVTAIGWLTTKGLGFVVDKWNWFQNGKYLSKGFISGTKNFFGKKSVADVGGGDVTGPAPGGTGGPGGTGALGGRSRGPTRGGNVPGTIAETTSAAPTTGGAATTGAAATGKLNFKSVGKSALAGLAVGGLEMMQSGDINAESIGNMAGNAIGGALGTLLDPVLGPFGTMIGAELGGMLGGFVGKEFFSDGIFGSPVHDANFSKGRGIIQGGKITPIDNKDDLVAMKKGGPISNAINGSNQTMNVDFGEITINGKIELTSGGSPGITVDLLKDPGFRRDITRVVSTEIEKNRNGGKNIG